MRILTVFAHPKRASYSGAVLDAFLRGLGDAGHEWKLADLYTEGFDPRFRAKDYAQFTTGPADMPEDVLAEQQRIEWAEAIALVFPVWWWSFPAMLKGWIDRVWCNGWAYDFTIQRSTGHLDLSKAVLLCPGGSSADVYRRYGYQEGMRRCIDVGVLGYCGIDTVDMHIFPGVDDAAEGRPEYLKIAEQIGRDFAKRDPVVSLSSLSQVDRPA
jgi:NAD(P)H dehydrogenase (quinone)